ncbi:MAG: ABC transporter permease subunit [Clostridiales Family XIII bacterium]|nr:ABC transporter permease subunit [Clostridiales Family XIII bacterium]
MLPIFHFLEKLNPLALFPVIMLFAGIGDESKVFIIFWVVVWIVVFHTIAGIENVDPLYIQSAKSMGAGKLSLLFAVYFPAAAPEIFSGVKFGANIAFIFVISVEMLSASAGLGWFIANAKHQYNLANLYSTVLLIAIIGIIVSTLFNVLEEGRWRRFQNARRRERRSPRAPRERRRRFQNARRRGQRGLQAPRERRRRVPRRRIPSYIPDTAAP